MTCWGSLFEEIRAWNIGNKRAENSSEFWVGVVVCCGCCVGCCGLGCVWLLLVTVVGLRALE